MAECKIQERGVWSSNPYRATNREVYKRSCKGFESFMNNVLDSCMRTYILLLLSWPHRENICLLDGG